MFVRRSRLGMYRISGYPAIRPIFHYPVSGYPVSGLLLNYPVSGRISYWYPAGYRIIALLAVTSNSRNTPWIVVVLGEDHDVTSNYELLYLGQFSLEFYETCFKLKNKPLPFIHRNYFSNFFFIYFFFKSDFSVLVDLEKFQP